MSRDCRISPFDRATVAEFKLRVLKRAASCDFVLPVETIWRERALQGRRSEGDAPNAAHVLPWVLCSLRHWLEVRPELCEYFSKNC